MQIGCSFSPNSGVGTNVFFCYCCHIFKKSIFLVQRLKSDMEVMKLNIISFVSLLPTPGSSLCSTLVVAS